MLAPAFFKAFKNFLRSLDFIDFGTLTVIFEEVFLNAPVLMDGAVVFWYVIFFSFLQS